MNKAFTRSLLLFSSIMLSGLSMAATSSDAVYRPMFEIGKTWKYTLCDFQYIFQPIPDLNWELRIDDIVVEDGKEYFVMNAYVDNFDSPVEGGSYA